MRTKIFINAMKSTSYDGLVDMTPTKEILLNIKHLDRGKYVLKIIHKNKVLKSTFFIKE